MQKTSPLFSFAVLLFSATVLAGCMAGNTEAVPDEANQAAPNTSVEKSGTTTLTGTLKVQGKNAVLVTPTGNVPLESYELAFTDYDGKKVTAVGKYSGDTLFVNSISE